MFLDDSFENVGGTTVIPSSFGVDDGNRAAGTHTKAVGFRAEYATHAGEAKLVQTILQELPRLQTFFFFRTFRLGLIAAEEYVPLDFVDVERKGGS